MSVVSTRAELRTSLQRKTDGDLTVSADQDYYLDLAELEVMSDWYQFDPGVFGSVRQSATTDSDGILLLPTTFLEMFALEEANERKYYPIKVENRYRNDGWISVGYDIASGKRKLQIVESGRNVGNKTLYFYTSDRVTMGALTTDSPVYPLEFRDLIAMKAAQLYYEDQDETYEQFARRKEARYDRRLAKAIEMYDRPNQWPEFAHSTDMDAMPSSALQRSEGYLL